MSSATLVGGVDARAAPKRSRVSSVSIWVSFVVVGGVIVMAAFGPWLAPQDPHAQHLSIPYASPSGAHWLGTDQLGQDMFSRVIVGTRTAMIGPAIIACASFLIGNVLGLLAGYRRGSFDSVIMRWVDLMWSIPGLLVIIVVQGALGGGYWLAIGLLTLLTIPFDARVVRGATLEQATRPYVEAAKTCGSPDWRIMFVDIWPNVSPVSIANAFLVFAGSLVTLSTLSYLGLGVAPGAPDWGLMLSDNQQALFLDPVVTLAPGVMLVIATASLNLIGDWVYGRLASRGASR